MRATWLALLAIAGCGDDGTSEPTSLVITTTFPVTTMFGSSSSYLQKYIGQEVSFEVTFPYFFVDRFASTEDCNNTEVHLANAPRVAHGANAMAAQAELLDPLDQDWVVSYEYCADASRSILSLDSVIDPYNLAFGCAEVPANAQQIGSDGFPAISTVTATRCTATILDVINVYSVGSEGFSMTVTAK